MTYWSLQYISVIMEQYPERVRWVLRTEFKFLHRKLKQDTMHNFIEWIYNNSFWWQNIDRYIKWYNIFTPIYKIHMLSINHNYINSHNNMAIILPIGDIQISRGETHWNSLTEICSKSKFVSLNLRLMKAILLVKTKLT